MRTHLMWLVCLVMMGSSAAVRAQNGPPTRPAMPSTPEQDKSIAEGAALHDQGKFDQAIAKYAEVLKVSPNNMTALYELAYSFAAGKEYAKALETAIRGTEYQSDLLPMFYDLIGSAHDSMGNPDKAIDAYKKGIQVVPDAGMLYYNMGVTYLESLKNPDEARKALEKAVTLDPEQPDFHLMLGQVFQTTGYKTPALLAFSTYLILEPTGPRSINAYANWRALLRGGIETPRDGSPSPDGPMRDSAMMTAQKAGPSKTDEGDFVDFETEITRSQRVVIAEMDNGAEEMPAFLAHVGRVFASLAARPAARDRGTFVGTQYLPLFQELQRKNFVEPFVYWSIQRAPVRGAREWLTANQSRVREFVEWRKAFRP